MSYLPPEHAVDLLVVSAFPNDYAPTYSSLIGALFDNGVSVADLAKHKKADLREQFSCWLSEPIQASLGFQQIMCIESGWRGTPPEITDDLFRALAPYVITDMRDISVAMPLIGAGIQGWPPDQMMESILKAAISWMNRGLPLRLLKIITRSPEVAKLALQSFRNVQSHHVAGNSPALAGAQSEPAKPDRSGNRTVDLFISYCHEDSKVAQTILATLQSNCPSMEIFHDRSTLKPGGSWLMQVAESLDCARRVVALYTPQYWSSPFCKDEFAAALTRQNDTGRPILFPIYFRSAPIPYLFRNLQFEDCREEDEAKLVQVCDALAKSFS
jgi:TIR domain-containing protein